MRTLAQALLSHFNKNLTTIEGAVVIIIKTLLNLTNHIYREGHTQCSHIRRIISRYITKMLAVELIDSDGVLVVLVGRFWLEVTTELAHILAYATAEIDACNIHTQILSVYLRV